MRACCCEGSHPISSFCCFEFNDNRREQLQCFNQYPHGNISCFNTWYNTTQKGGYYAGDVAAHRFRADDGEDAEAECCAPMLVLASLCQLVASFFYLGDHGQGTGHCVGGGLLTGLIRLPAPVLTQTLCGCSFMCGTICYSFFFAFSEKCGTSWLDADHLNTSEIP